MKKQNTFRRGMQFVCLSLIALFAIGCQHVNHLRDAQDSFNQAAALENESKFNPASLSSTQEEAVAAARLTSLSTVKSGYAAALLSLKTMPKDQVKQLKQDKLWGVALTLQALSEWKLGQHAAALKTADLAISSASDQTYPRDAAILQALPGLIRIDVAFSDISSKLSPLIVPPPNATEEQLNQIATANRSLITITNNGIFTTNIATKLLSFTTSLPPTASTNSNEKLATIKSLLAGTPVPGSDRVSVTELKSVMNVTSLKQLLNGGAISDLQTAITKSGDNHPIDVFLVQSQLAAYRNYSVGFGQSYAIPPASIKQTLAFDLAKELVDDLEKLLKELNVEPAKITSAVEFWRNTYDIK